MTSLPSPSPKKLGLVIDLDVCVGCHACAVNCKEWNSGGHAAPLSDFASASNASIRLNASAVFPSLNSAQASSESMK